MSLKQFLAVGKSFAGSPRERSPFEMRKEIRLPRFENAPRFTAKLPVTVQTDWLEEKKHARPLGAPFAAESAPARPSALRRRRSWLEVLTFGLLGRPKAEAALVQSELGLENVRVIRNDLADSDLEVVVKKQKKFALRRVRVEDPPARAAAVTDKAREWSELRAKLFEIGRH